MAAWEMRSPFKNSNYKSAMATPAAGIALLQADLLHLRVEGKLGDRSFVLVLVQVSEARYKPLSVPGERSDSTVI
ncbi:hypothetical protein, partial [uncultured Nostoc sp.]|uniref:hypothetical protein n=1 Tax=uncultured Nostoc sp. TaxID=340711 RepID=UPI0035CA6545